MLRFVIVGLIIISFALLGTSSFLAEPEPLNARYYNSMLNGGGRNIHNCQNVYNDVDVDVVKDCGVGMDGTCNKRIVSRQGLGIEDVRNNFNTTIENLGLNLEATVNSNNSCMF
ncbi:MAG: hypothetical protein F6K55_09960 [Moorea sp. SIO4A3]|nr:hypothetical protein [Moorena sp. SIO4A3]